MLVCWSVSLFVCRCVSLFVYLFVGLSVCWSVCIFVCHVGLSVCWSVCMFVCQSVGLLICWSVSVSVSVRKRRVYKGKDQYSILGHNRSSNIAMFSIHLRIVKTVIRLQTEERGRERVYPFPPRPAPLPVVTLL